MLAPDALGTTAWRGLGPVDVVPGAALVLAGAGTGWRHDAGVTWSTGRRWRRAGILVVAGAVIATARTWGTGEVAGPDELLRLAAATGLAAGLVRLPVWLLAPATVGLLAAPATLVGAGALGRGLGTLPPEAGWSAEAALGLPATGVPLASLPAAIGLVLVGHGLGVWLHRRPAGPASGALLLTLAVWCAVIAVVAAQLRPPIPALLDLTVALAATTTALALTAVGHLVAVTAARRGDGPGTLVAVGRTAIVPVTIGAVAVGVVNTAAAPLATLPVGSALTVGAVTAAATAAGCRALHAWRGPLRA